MQTIKVLDCTLRDGAYIVNGIFGKRNISGIIKKLCAANVDIIECGWLKMCKHDPDSTYYHVPNDIGQYVKENENQILVAMIDYDRYDCSILPEKRTSCLDAIRVVFPKGKVKDGIEVAKKIREKGYDVYLQAANTLGYSDSELLELVSEVNKFSPTALSIVDTFGAMYSYDLERIVYILNHNLSDGIKLGFHSHNNKQLSFSLVMDFIDVCISKTDRDLIIDSSLCGMGRGAGNACTELVINYLNERYHATYNLNEIMDGIDIYMKGIMKRYSWGYSVQYALAGIYGCHVNNVAYLMDAHRIKDKDMKIVFESLPEDKRVQYDYENLETLYTKCKNVEVDDTHAISLLKRKYKGRSALLILPGYSSQKYHDKINEYIMRNDVDVFGVNSYLEGFRYDELFFSNSKKYEYYKMNVELKTTSGRMILTSNVDSPSKDDIVINYNGIQKGKWKYKDNSLILLLRLLAKVEMIDIIIAGLDGFIGVESEYAAGTLEPQFSSDDERFLIQSELKSMLSDFIKTYEDKIAVRCITKSPFDNIITDSGHL